MCGRLKESPDAVCVCLGDIPATSVQGSVVGVEKQTTILNGVGRGLGKR